MTCVRKLSVWNRRVSPYLLTSYFVSTFYRCHMDKILQNRGVRGHSDPCSNEHWNIILVPVLLSCPVWSVEEKLKIKKIFFIEGRNVYITVKTNTMSAPHDKTSNVACAPSEDSDQSSLSVWRKLGSLATHWVHSEYSDQAVRMPRLIWVFAESTIIFLVLSRGGIT